jgi:hypothetical protein
MANLEESYDGILVGAITKRSSEQIAIGIREFKGSRFFEIRTYFLGSDGAWIPTKKGLTLAPEYYPDFFAMIANVGVALGMDEG